MGTKRRKVGAVSLVAVAMIAAALPPGGTFKDDDGNVHEGFIEAIAAEGITRGCNPPHNDRYCPRQPVTREQMAAFLVRALGLTASGTVDFVDDDGSLFEADIERLATAGITVGCNPPQNDRFCPNDPVTRDQMASFLGRALELAPIVVAPFGGEVVVGTDQEPPTLNPYAPGGDTAIVTTIGQAYFGGVYEIDGRTQELIPDLVTELPTVANGGVTVNDDETMTVVYNIDPDAVWSDGVPISGTDFQFTLDVIMNPDNLADVTIYENIVSTRVNPKRYEITLAAPTLAYEMLFPMVIPKHAVADTDFAVDWNDVIWPSAGPFVFDSWDKGVQLRLVRNDQYWKADPTSNRNLPFLDSVVFKFIPDPSDLMPEFSTRSVDVIEPYSEMDVIAQLDALSGAVVDSADGPVWEHINFQFDPARAAKNDVSVNEHLDYRKAIAHGIDRNAIATDIYDGWATGLNSYVDTATPAFSIDAWAQYDFAVAKARSLVKSTEQHFGVDELMMVFTTTANNDARVRIAEMMVQMMDDIGIEYENQLMDSMTFFGETLEHGQWDVGAWAWVGSPGYSGAAKLLEVFDPDAPPPDGENYYRWGSPGSTLVDSASMRFADLRDEIEGEVDHRAVLPLLQEAEQILGDNVIVIPLYARPVFLAHWADEVGGMGATPQPFTWNIEEWYRADL